MSAVLKGTAFILRTASTGDVLLLFEHSNGGIQIPAGTVEPGEAVQTAALREAREETGLEVLAANLPRVFPTGSLPT